MRVLLFCLLSTQLIGCGYFGSSKGKSVASSDATKADPTPLSIPAEPKATKPYDPVDSLPTTLEVTYKGRNAETNYKMMLDRSYPIANSGACGLYDIGEESLRFLYKGLNHENDTVRFLALRSMPRCWVKYKDVFYDILVWYRDNDKNKVMRKMATDALTFLTLGHVKN